MGLGADRKSFRRKRVGKDLDAARINTDFLNQPVACVVAHGEHQVRVLERFSTGPAIQIPGIDSVGHQNVRDASELPDDLRHRAEVQVRGNDQSGPFKPSPAQTLRGEAR